MEDANRTSKIPHSRRRLADEVGAPSSGVHPKNQPLTSHPKQTTYLDDPDAINVGRVTRKWRPVSK